MDDLPEVIAREPTPRGEVVLRRRAAGGPVAASPVAASRAAASDRGSRADSREGRPDSIIELIVNGAFVMDTEETSTERLLAATALERSETPGTVVVGGLGLGFTVQALLADDRVRQVDVVELEPAVVRWIGDGLVPATAGVLDDQRVRSHIADFRHWLPGQPDAGADVVLLDVDNGPDFLVHESNAALYRGEFVTEIARVLRPYGVLVVWSSTAAPELCQVLQERFGACTEIHETLQRSGRRLDYYLYAATLTTSATPYPSRE